MALKTKLGEILPKKTVNTELPIWPILFYFGAVTFQLTASTIFHWFIIVTKMKNKIGCSDKTPTD